ncbi:cytochrome P450 [Athelia psychrophila]|uniref:Cytochrome P450 n=1 Tax=Athelia psychrophila TaxID=1759441 RepID=A0A166KB29_9AGAM|nr:cytochrome P450 [Fibularhizoctonia sp. CBS 109695]
MHPIALLLISILTTFALLKVTRLLAHYLSSPLRSLPGPPSPSFLYGAHPQLAAAPAHTAAAWTAAYGPTFAFPGLLSQRRLFTIDPRALAHVLKESYIWQKPEAVRYSLGTILGEGMLFVEADKHRLQRKVMIPAFGPAQIRALTSVFTDKAAKLRDLWLAEIASSPAPSSSSANTNSPAARIDVLERLSKATLDAIGSAGFAYDFHALDTASSSASPSSPETPTETPPETSPLLAAFTTLLRAGKDLGLLGVVQLFVPAARRIETRTHRRVHAAQDAMRAVGEALVDDAKAAAEGGEEEGTKDLLSLLVKANAREHDKDKELDGGAGGAGTGGMSDADVLAQVPTFLVAGHETTSTAVAWALLALARNPAAQATLRASLAAATSDAPGMDALGGYEYLDWVVRETLRLHAPVTGTYRAATAADTLPLATPLPDGRTALAVRAGDVVYIPILGVNRAKAVWGADADAWRPERWAGGGAGDAKRREIPGVWGNMLTFLGGPRACIGYRFALVEMKALLYTLVRAFAFELAVDPRELGVVHGLVQAPMLEAEGGGKGAQLPLLVRAYVPEGDL